MKRIVLALALLLLTLPALPARAAGGNGQFVMRCPYSHTLMDDPIVVPGQPGASHSHDFFGNKSVNAFSTVASMLAADTTCRAPGDTAGYWTPTASMNGVQIEPPVMRIYYLGSRTERVETIPSGLQVIGGNKLATSPAENPHVEWNCGETVFVKTPQSDAPYDCTPWSSYPWVEGIIGLIELPSCWDGTGLRPEDVIYPVGDTCPGTFRHVLPRLSVRVHFGIMNPLNPDGTVALTLSSGPYYTLHSDFWNTWQQARLDQLVNDCLVARMHCRAVDATNTIAWTRQFGTTRYDLAYAAAPDGEGGTYVAGFTGYALKGQRYHHRYDAFLRRYDATGTVLWTRQFGTSGNDRATAIAVAGSAVYVSGSTDGRFPKQDAPGGLDAFVVRFDADGNQLWLRQFGTRSDDEATSVAATDTAVYVAGTTHGSLARSPRRGPSDAFVVRLDAGGEETWARRLGGDGEDSASAVTVRSDVVYAAGSTEGLRGVTGIPDAFVATLGTDGSAGWAEELGSSEPDAATSLSARGEGVFVAGWTAGALPEQTPAGGMDAFVGKLGPDGSVVWIRQFGSAADDDAAAVAVLGKGVYVAGSTLGQLPDGTFLGESDGFLRKYTPTGTEVWTQQVGTTDYDRVYGAEVDTRGAVVVGTTHGALEGYTNAGDRDVFVIRVAFV